MRTSATKRINFKSVNEAASFFGVSTSEIRKSKEHTLNINHHRVWTCTGKHPVAETNEYFDSIKQAAEFFKCTPQTISSHIKSGKDINGYTIEMDIDF